MPTGHIFPRNGVVLPEIAVEGLGSTGPALLVWKSFNDICLLSHKVLCS